MMARQTHPVLPHGRTATGETASASVRWLPDATTVALLLSIAALWLATRPYYGIVQDTRFYLLPALRLLHPAQFADELYFRFGATDRFTIFPRLFAPLIAGVGLGRAAMLGTIAGQALWLGGLWYLASGMLRDRGVVLLAVAAAIALPGGYSHYAYGEAFVTPRLFAEALTMMAFGLIVRERAWPGLLLLAVAAAIHPVMTLPGLAVALVYLAFGRPVWWWAIAGGGIAGLGLALAGIEPFADLRASFDPAWFAIARTRVSEITVMTWSATDYCRVAATLALGAVGLVFGDDADRRLLAVALAIAIGGLVSTLLGADLAHNLFVTEMLPWRAMWLLTVLSQLSVVPVVVRLYRFGAIFAVTRLVFLAALGCLLLSRLIAPVVLIASPLMVVAAGSALWQRRAGRPLPDPVRAAGRVAAIVACGAAIGFAGEFVALMQRLPDELWQRIVSFAIVLAAAVLVIGLRPAADRRRWLAGAAPWLAGGLVAAALAGWDIRTPWTRFVETAGPPPAALLATLPRQSSVYWEGGVEMLWFRLGRPSYFSCAQGTGAVYFRGLAIEWERRAEALRPLHPVDFDAPECHSFGGGSEGYRRRADLQQMCRAAPELDHLVLMRPVAEVAGTVWESPVPLRSVTTADGLPRVEETRRFYVYSCAGLR